MGRSRGVEFMRGVLLVLNILFVIVGITLIGLGVYMKVDDNFASILSQIADISDFKGQSLGFLAFAMIGGGVFTLLIALFGCMGEFRVRYLNDIIYSIYLNRSVMEESMFLIYVCHNSCFVNDCGISWFYYGICLQRPTYRGL